MHCAGGVSDLRYCPSSRLDAAACAVAQLTRDRDAANATTPIMTCTLQCRTNDTASAHHLCGGTPTAAAAADCAYAMTAHIKMNHIERLGDCLFFALKEASIHSTSSE